MNKNFYAELKQELTQDILPYWTKHARDTVNGGFFGSIDNNNKCKAKEERSVVMVSRFLWSYSAAARLLKDASYMEMADWAYAYLSKYFFDTYYGGVFWSVSASGKALITRKQIYGNAFALYALSEYAAALLEIKKEETPAQVVMTHALTLFTLLEKHAKDAKQGGYWEARAQNWAETKETKKSKKDIDCDKSMNTNLHVMEAYTNLYRTLPLVFPHKSAEQKQIGHALEELISVHVSHILNKKDFHLDLYFNKNWKQTGKDEISYGHDIEASWLLWEAATELGKKTLQNALKPIVLTVAEKSLVEGFDPSTGGFENTFLNGTKDTTRVWWNQAEALNGFYNAWEITGRTDFAKAVEGVWQWIVTKQKDKVHGEWFAEVSKDGVPNKKEAKGGNWKTSYHNARCCMELMRRM